MNDDCLANLAGGPFGFRTPMFARGQMSLILNEKRETIPGLRTQPFVALVFAFLRPRLLSKKFLIFRCGIVDAFGRGGLGPAALPRVLMTRAL